MRRAAVLLVALLALAPVAAEGKRPRAGKGTVKAGYGKAPARWKQLSAWATATPTPAATPAPSATPTVTSTLPPPSTRSVSVGATEFALTLSQATVDAGEVRVVFDNSRAEDPHQLAIEDAQTFPEVAAGGVARYTVTFAPGRHVLVCPLPGHEQLGMRAVLTAK